MKTKFKKISSVFTSLCIIVMISVSFSLPVSAGGILYATEVIINDNVYKVGDTIEIIYKFSEPVVVAAESDPKDLPNIILSIGSNTDITHKSHQVKAYYSSGSGGTDLKFTYTVTQQDDDSDGIRLIGWNINNPIRSKDSGIEVYLRTNPQTNVIYAGVLIDNTDPIIAGVEDGLTYTTPKAITYSDANILSAKLVNNGGTPTDFTSGTTISVSGNYTLTVTDKAGHAATVNFTMNIPVVTTPNTNSNNDNTSSKSTEKAVEKITPQVSISGIAHSNSFAAEYVDGTAGEPAQLRIQPFSNESANANTLQNVIIGFFGYISGTPLANAPVTHTIIGLQFRMFDMSLISNGTGAVIQPPASGIRVTFPVPDDMTASSDSLRAVTLDPKTNKLEPLETIYIIVNDVPCVRFTVTHFSPYAVVVDKYGKLTTLAAGESTSDYAKPITQNS